MSFEEVTATSLTAAYISLDSFIGSSRITNNSDHYYILSHVGLEHCHLVWRCGS
jgi:hypothetical protein